MVDAGGSDAYWPNGLKRALRTAEMLARHDVYWFEEALKPEAIEDYVQLRRASPVPIAAGEVLTRRQTFRPWFVQGALDIVQPDLALCGGFSEGLRIATLADAFEVPLIPHVWGTGINFCAALQFASVLPDYKGPGIRYPLFEYDFSFNPLRDAFGSFPLGPDGTMSPPAGPGLGIDIEPGRFAEHVVDRWSIGA